MLAAFAIRIHPFAALARIGSRQVKVKIAVGAEPRDLYDAVSGTFLKRRVENVTSFSVPANDATLLVVVPSGGKAEKQNGRLLVDGIVVDYRAQL